MSVRGGCAWATCEMGSFLEGLYNQPLEGERHGADIRLLAGTGV